MIIYSVDDLLKITSDSFIDIAKDIDCGGMEVSCICSVFRGTIIGNNHKISNIVVSEPVWGDEQKISLFRYMSHATIQDLFLDNIRFEVDQGEYRPSVSSFCGEVIDSTIQNVSMNAFTSDGKNIPMIYECDGCETIDLRYSCNKQEYKIFKYKEGKML